VSVTSGSEVATPLTTEFELLAVWVCLSINVKLKFSSSSFVRRKRNVGADADEERSGSCIYSIGLSSPTSRFAAYLVAGKELGVRCKNTRPRELLIVAEEIVSLVWSLKNKFPESSRRLPTLPIMKMNE
jgi:hypothetical protein